MSSFEGALKNPGDKAKRDANAGRGWYAVLARTGLVAKGLSLCHTTRRKSPSCAQIVNWPWLI